ncbi:MAG: repressor LexA [Thermosediminibacterales bacterium]|nr:repressor LexA [Thermosediminibacterales bacterium]
MNDDLTIRQKDILHFIKKEISEKGYPPSVREICKAVGLNSTSTVHSHLENLEKKGYIRRNKSKPRAIEVIDFDFDFFSSSKTVNVPLIGRVTAGQPILAQQNIEDIIPLPKNFFHDEDVFMLSVRGDSMINAGILDNDYIVVRKQNTANNGDIVVALIEDEATVKRFFKEKDHIRLQPENPAMSPIIIRDVIILGKVIGVLRKLR